MAVCQWCLGEMTEVDSCTVGAFHRDGKRFAMIPFGKEPEWRGSSMIRCGDCGVARGKWHHPGCDIQLCPRCRRQAMTCGCRFDEDGPDEEEPDEEWEQSWAEPLGVDANGNLTEGLTFGGYEVILHHQDIPESDVTTHRGIRCTTALRTIIDISVERSEKDLKAMVGNAIARGLFTVDEALLRLDQPDMADHRGALKVRQALPPTGP